MSSGIFSGRREVRMKKLWGRYAVGDDGNVYSDGMPLSAIGGVGVNLGGKRVKVAYLVARAFVPNAECRQYLRHKNGDVTDNRACNLEWSDEKEEKRRGRKACVCWCRAWNMDGEIVGTWRTVSEAAEACGVKVDAVRRAVNGLQKSAGGLLWRRV